LMRTPPAAIKHLWLLMHEITSPLYRIPSIPAKALFSARKFYQFFNY